jgi:ribosomal protein S27E
MFGYDVDYGGIFDTEEEAAEAWNRRSGKQERKRGEWIITSEFENCRYAKCNQCKTTQVFYYNKPLTNFCPNCGADMREDVLPPAQPVLTCKGCKYDYYEYAGCRNCLRKERELYEPE